MQSRTIYEEHSHKNVTFSSVGENLDCEILIVGGGLAGLSLAYQLAIQNQKFIAIEARKIGDCASGINGGFCSPGWSIDFGTLTKQFVSVNSKKLTELSIEGLEW